MKLNIPEFAHYIVGGLLLLAAWVPLMNYFQNDVFLTSTAWLVWYILIDQILHVVLKGEKISIVVKQDVRVFNGEFGFAFSLSYGYLYNPSFPR